MTKNLLWMGIAVFAILNLSDLPSVSVSAQGKYRCDSGPYTATIGFSADGQFVYSAWSTGDQNPSLSYVVWQTSTGKVVRSYPETNPTAAAVSPDGKYFAIGDFHILKVTDFNTGKELFSVETNFEITGLRFLNGNKWLLSIEVGETNLWDVATGKLLQSFLTSTPERGASETLSPDEKYFFAVGGEDGDAPLALWDVATGKTVRSFKGFSGAFSPDSKLIATDDGKNIVIWDITAQSGRSINYPADPTGYSSDRMIRSFSPDGKYLIVSVDVWGSASLAGEQGSDDVVLYSAIEVWDEQTGKLLWDFGKQGTSALLGIFPDREHLLIINSDGYELWDIKTQQRERKFLIDDQWQIQPSGVFATSPDGNYLLSRTLISNDGSAGFLVSLRDIKTGKKVMDYCVSNIQ